MLRASRLVAVRQSQRTSKRQWMRARQAGQGSKPFGMSVCDLPCEAGTPVVADQVKPLVPMSQSCNDIEGVTDQPVNLVLRVIGRIGPGIEFTLFIAATMGTLNLFFASYLKAADRINAAPPEKQTEMVLTLGCLLLVIMALLVPVLIVIMINVG